MAVYHRDNAELFERAVCSVYENTLRPDAFVLVVDGPVPDLLGRKIGALQKRFGFIIHVLAQNQGLASALNAGLDKVTTEWVLRADADDINLATRFEQQASMVERDPSLAIIGAAILEVEPDGKALAVRRPPSSHAEIMRFARVRNPFNHMTVAYRTSLAKRCGGYPNIRLKEDYGLWALMLQRGAQTANLPGILVHATAGQDMYRRRGGWQYARDEILLQRHLLDCGLKGRMTACIHGFGRGIVFLFPAWLRGMFYRRALRFRGVSRGVERRSLWLS
jgi:glycosyltransferase involved in cell wall biosynthesis